MRVFTSWTNLYWYVLATNVTCILRVSEEFSPPCWTSVLDIPMLASWHNCWHTSDLVAKYKRNSYETVRSSWFTKYSWHCNQLLNVWLFLQAPTHRGVLFLTYCNGEHEHSASETIPVQNSRLYFALKYTDILCAVVCCCVVVFFWVSQIKIIFFFFINNEENKQVHPICFSTTN